MRLWASYAERDAIHRKAQAARLTVGEYVRAAALAHPVQVVSLPPATVEARRNLAAIGHYLNRIVRAVEASGGDAVPADFRVTLDALQRQVDALALAMSAPLVVTTSAGD